MIEEEQLYGTLVLPFGLIQVFRDFDKLNPSSDEFDLIRTIEYAASPLHYTIGRDTSDSFADEFIVDVGNGELNRDLNFYKGFVPVNQPAAGGLASPTWGRTFRLRTAADGSFQGVYAGAGPYVSMRTAPVIDPRLTQILTPGAPVYVPNAQLFMTDITEGQLALAIAGGYRARIAWPESMGSGSEREGLYVGADYKYLHGFRYETFDFRLRLDTNSAGLLTLTPPPPPPLQVNRFSSESGRGMAIDVGVAAVLNRWEFGVGANGIANRINWSDVETTPYFHTNLVTGQGDLTEGPTVPLGDVRVELPIDYRANIGYATDQWRAVLEVGRGIQGESLHGGGEYRFTWFDVRGGAVYSRELWNPAGGIGIDLSPTISVDVAVYSNSANIERKRNPAIAVSLRFNR
jgi:hypothetical protein